MITFDFLHKDTKIENGKVLGKAGGALGGMMLPVPIEKYDNISKEASFVSC